MFDDHGKGLKIILYKNGTVRNNKEYKKMQGYVVVLTFQL